MKLVFVHDGPIFEDKDGQYYEYSYHGLYERYKYLADEITFIMRVYPVEKDTKGTKLPAEIKVINVPNFKSPSSYFLKKRIAEKNIEKQIRETDYAVLRESSCAKIALKYCKKYNKPYIYECVGCIWDGLWNHSLLGKLMAPSSFIIEKKIIKNAPYVYYVTDQFLQRRYPTKGKSIGCSNVVIDKVDESVLKKRLDKISGYHVDNKIKIGTAAALDVRYKGQEYVIKAIKKLVEQGYDLEYYLAGGNRKQSTFLKDLAVSLGVEKRVIFCGSLDAAEMPHFYDSLDIYIQPSKQEGLPRSVIEAMSRGCPVLGTKIAGIPELIEQKCLFKKGSVSAVTNSIVYILHSDLEKISIYNFQKAKKYTKEILADRRRHFYDQFLEEYRY
ncbi:glycosyltransferase [Lachnospiraceae bacterium WCA-9-b2]|uniref:Glycosyltransferase n=1 Tax=Sporofaciens musculi TaxID=2681861 RepID=A0A7X3MED7_9FIRM|nr:glycosyltransferase family 4 protein [Sporofaciens musculi]MXP74780.1 glycosyltransferase [Sporofaciens musculi]